MEAALDAWKKEKFRKEKEKKNKEWKNKKIAGYKARGLDEEEIYDLMCVEKDPCAIMGDYPLQKACQPDPNDPPGCPCPDLKCSKRAKFDNDMFDNDMSKYKSEFT